MREYHANKESFGIGEMKISINIKVLGKAENKLKHGGLIRIHIIQGIKIGGIIMVHNIKTNG